MTDIAGSWASPWIASVLDAGVMEPFANHTFQPQATLRRSDFAGIVSRVLGLASTVDPSRGRNWPHDRVTFTDVAEGHPAFDAVSRAVGARILTTSPQGAFEPTRPVTGAEAAEAIARLQRLVGTRAAERKP